MQKSWDIFKKFSYPLGAFPRGAYIAFVNSLLPLYLLLFTDNAAVIGFLVSISAFEGSLIPLMIGPLSDRTYSRIGGRKIYILIGSILTSGLLVLFPFAKRLDLLIAVVVLAGAANSISSAPHLAMITSNSKKDFRSQMVALIGVFYLIGQITITCIFLFFWRKEVDQNLFLVLASLIFVPVIPLLFYSKDRNAPLESSGKFDVKAWLSFFTDKSRNIYMLSQFVLWFGINSILPFLTLFIKNYLMLPQQNAILFYLIVVVSSGIFAFPFAMLGRKRNELRVFQFGLSFLLAAGFIGIFAKQMPEIIQYAVAFLAGIGNAATTAFSYSIFSKIVPEKLIGMAGGVNTFLISGFAPIAALLSGLLISIFDYPAMFVVLLITTATSIILLNQKIKSAS